MESQGVEGKEVVTVPAGRPVMFKVQIADHDESRMYRLSEATQQGLRYQKTILQQPANPESWFSLYELRKVKAVDPSVKVDPNQREYVFESADAAVLFTEQMLTKCGYEITRRPNWEHAVFLDLDQMAADMGFMTSLVIAEHDWEVSVMHYRGLGAGYHKPRYGVIEDVLYTPQTKATRYRSLTADVQEPEDEDAALSLKSPVKKTLNFADVSSSGSEGEAPATPPTEAKPKALVDALVEMTALGKISTEDFAKLLAGLNKASASQSEPVRSRVEYASKAEYPSREDARQSRSRSASYSREWGSSIEDDMGLTSQDRSDARDGEGSRRHFTTIIQNVALRSFDGSKTDPEEARQWLSKFLHNANLAGWSSAQRLDAFADNLTNPARYWFRQLPLHVRTDWKAALNAFHARYCADNVSPMRLYHAMTQKQDESPLNYFYRFNAAALRAKLDIRRANEDDDWMPPPSDLKDHLDFFWDSLHDHAVAERFRFDEYRSIAQVERLLSRRERTMVKQPKKKEQKKSAGEGGTSDQPAPAVNKVNHGGRSAGGDGGGAGSVVCDHCGRAGHVKAACYQLQKCEYCDKVGHTLNYCREFIDKIALMRAKVKSGELSSEELAQQLNK